MNKSDQKQLNQALMIACRKRNLELIKKFIKIGADINYHDGYWSPIGIVSNRGYSEIVRYLISINCYIDDVAFDEASGSGHLEILKMLYEHGDSTDINCALIRACGNGHLDVIKYLISIGCNPNKKCIHGHIYPINYACEYGHLEVVKYLYSIGCDPTANNNNAILMASANGHLEVVKFLALVGCDTDKIENKYIKEIIIEYLNKYKHIMDKCLTEIHGHPQLERTKTENEIYFQELNKLI